MKVIILSKSSWDDTNSLGNTLTNIFSGWDIDKIAHIYCKAARPSNTVCRYYYSIHEKELLKSIFDRKNKPGHAFVWDEKTSAGEAVTKEEKIEERLYSFFSRNSSVLAKWTQDLLWTIGKWHNDNLDTFLFDFKPDIIFAPVSSAIYTYRLLWYIQKKTSAKVVLFHTDDYLTIKRLHYSLLSNIDRKILAKVVTASVRKADLNYCISSKQQKEYSLKLKREMKLLHKGGDFSIQPAYKRSGKKDLIRIVYVGSVMYGRWRTLGALARVIKKINMDLTRIELLIYSQCKLTKKINNYMVVEGASRFMGKIPAAQVSDTLNNADILLHVESLDKKVRFASRLSFSTKIVDLLHSARCIMAIGWKESASIDYLMKNDAAIVANDMADVTKQLEKIISNPEIISEYAKKAWECGKRNHQIDIIQKNLYKDLADLAGKNKNENITD